MKKIHKKNLLEAAKKASHTSYSPYSSFRVGAALLCRDGTIITGTNVENRSFGLTSCAERNALYSAVASGKRDFLAVCIYSPDHKTALPPCGACRQVLSEFVRDDFSIIMAGDEEVVETTIAELLPWDSLHGLTPPSHEDDNR
ncbi:MAG: cytidine deaminase [Spirochaetales bacterium]|nr:cytidine deaminase [Spirochaetales bacterium]